MKFTLKNMIAVTGCSLLACLIVPLAADTEKSASPEKKISPEMQKRRADMDAYRASLPASEKEGIRNKESVRLQGRTKEIDDRVRRALELSLKKEYQQAIDLYHEAKKMWEELEKEYPDNRKYCKDKIDDCVRQISDNYFFWAKDYYFSALKEAKSQNYVKAIDYCKEAMQIYPPCKDKMKEMIRKYEKLRDSSIYTSQVETLATDKKKQYDIEVLVRQGQTLYNSGQWHVARAKFEEVIAMDPYNETAIDYMRRINWRMLSVGRLRTLPSNSARFAQAQWSSVLPLIKLNNGIPEDVPADGQGVSKNVPMQSINDKLKNIIIKDLNLEEVSIPTAIKYLRQMSRENDKEGIGVNFVLRGSINSASAGEDDAAEGDTKDQNKQKTDTAKKADAADEEAGEQSLSMILENLPLERVIAYICKQANLKYRVDENAVVIASKDVPLDDVVTRVYPVEKDAIALAEGQTAKEFFKDHLIDFSEPNSNIVFDEPISRLIMTNTPAQHAKLEELLKEMNTNDPQVLIQTKFIEISLNDVEELGFKYAISRSASNITPITKDGAIPIVANGNNSSFVLPYDASIYQQMSTGNNTGDTANYGWLNFVNTAKGGQIVNTTNGNFYYTRNPISQSAYTGTIGGQDVVRALDKGMTISTTPGDNYGLAASYSTFNSQGYKFDAKIYALDKADTADVLSSPRVTTMNNSTATIKFVTEKYYPTEWEEAEYTYMGNNVPVFTGSIPTLDDATEEGIMLSVTPSVGADGYTIQLVMRPLIRTFSGWDDYSYNVPMSLDGNNGNMENVPNTVKMPRFEERTVDTNVECSDNGTVVLGGLIRDDSTVLDDQYPILGELPLVGRLFQSKGRAGSKYNLLIFLSCRLVDPAGAPLREREDRGVPPFKN